MTKFVRLEGNRAIAISRIGWIETPAWKPGQREDNHQVYDHDGKDLGEIDPPTGWALQQPSLAVVPNTLDVRLARLWEIHNDKGDLKAGDVLVDYVPILAWQVPPMGLYPGLWPHLMGPIPIVLGGLPKHWVIEEKFAGRTRHIGPLGNETNLEEVVERLRKPKAKTRTKDEA